VLNSGASRFLVPTAAPSPILLLLITNNTLFSLLVRYGTAAHGTRHTAHGTRHTAHGTLHTTHGTRHTTHDTRHTTHDTRHTHYLLLLFIEPFGAERVSSTLHGEQRDRRDERIYLLAALFQRNEGLIAPPRLGENHNRQGNYLSELAMEYWPL